MPTAFLDLVFAQNREPLQLRYGEGVPTDAKTWVELTELRQVHSSLLAVVWLAVAVKATGRPTQEGEQGSVVCCLYELKPATKWVKDVFGCDSRKLLRRQLLDKRTRYTVRFANLTAADIRVFIRGDTLAEVTDPAQLMDLLGALGNEVGRRGAPPAPGGGPPVPGGAESVALARPLRVNFLMGATTLHYVQAIRDGLTAALAAGVAEGSRGKLILDGIVRLADDAADDAVTAARVREFLDKHRQAPADYWVAVGSPAAVALKKELSADHPPVLAVGVTNPARLGLPAHRGHRHRVGVLRYGQGMHAYPAILDEHVFPFLPPECRRFAFVYNHRIPHEVAAAHELHGLPVTDAGRLVLVGFDGYPTADELRRRCEGRIVFGWYALDYQLDKSAYTAAEVDELFITSTHRQHARDGATAVAIQPSDEEIGRRAAEMLLADSRAGGQGRVFAGGVEVVAERYWVNWPRLRAWAARLGEPNPPAYADPLCDEVFGAE